MADRDIVNAYFRRFYPPQKLLDQAEPIWGGIGVERPVKGYSHVFPAMVCADGLRLSVQGHYGAYSVPRDDWADEYRAVEIMGPQNADDLLAPYARACNAIDDEMVYPFVPVSVVLAVIAKHGGLTDPLADAAPEMLRALWSVVRALDGREHSNQAAAALADARHAIAKAEGRANG